MKHFGSAKTIKVDENFTHIVGGAHDRKLLDVRL